MLNTDERELIVKAHEKGIKISEIAKNFSVSQVTVYKYVNQMKAVGTVAVRTSERGRKSILVLVKQNCNSQSQNNYGNITCHGAIPPLCECGLTELYHNKT